MERLTATQGDSKERRDRTVPTASNAMEDK